MVDIGANVGLFTRSCINMASDTTEIFCYEPDPINFRYLQLNTRYLNSNQTHLINAGIADKSGSSDFYLDGENTGNNSLNIKSINPSSLKRITIDTLDVKKECEKWVMNGKKIFYKSDTQGYDETIIGEIPEEFWNNVYAGIFEIRRIKDKKFKIEAFAKFLDAYKYKVTGTKPQLIVSTSAILKFIMRKSDECDIDILFWN